MTVHLLRTPDYNPNDFFAVLSLLQSFNATDITFQAFERDTDPDEFPFLHRRVDRSRFEYELMEKVTYLPDRGFPLSWRELFGVCERFRQ